MLSPVLVSLIPLLAATNVLAKNDWSVPCITGSCSYDLDPNGSSSGSLKIWGGVNAITDVTQAADWEILDCDSNSAAQDIRLVCKNDPNETDSKCGHLYQNIGAVNKIVRLPESCGPMAFARIANAWVPDDQSIPESIQKRIIRRSNTPPVVKALRIDTNFDAVDWNKIGAVNLAIQGVNVPGMDMSNFNTGSQARRFNSRRSVKSGQVEFTEAVARGFFNDPLGTIKNGVNNAANDVKSVAKAGEAKATSAATSAATKAAAKAEDAGKKAGTVAKDAATKAKDAATKAATKAKDAATKAATKAKDAATKAATQAKGVATKAASKAKDVATNAASKAKGAATKVESAAKSVATTPFSASKSIDAPPLKFDKNVNLVNSAIQCFGKSLSLNVNMDANADVKTVLTVTASGTLTKIASFNVVAVMNGKLGGTIDMTADISGTIDSGLIPVFEIGIPGLVFPKILEIGPTFKVNAEVSGTMDVTMDMNVGVALDLNNTRIVFPPNKKAAPQSNMFSLGDAPLTLNAAPDVQATGTLTALLSPQLDLGISAFGGKAEAQVFLAVDTTADLTMALDGSTAVQKDKNGGAATETTDGTEEADEETADAEEDETTEADEAVDETDETAEDPDAEAPAAEARSLAGRASTTTVTPPSIGGCVNVTANVNVNVGADGSFFGLFNQLASVPLFNKDFKIFDKCFGDQATATAPADATAARRDITSPFDKRTSLERRVNLSCPIGSLGKSSITKGTIQSKLISSVSKLLI
ncbi:hypothetical protein MIND_00284700 [Mycena indigotica]|uniref:Uncharacterized protein n=1 Tax=Mycena indigotica TaxID=2126181 RepID=A0A8H6TBA5_9AGAR|nr:uncharacterized protein MIND_00284700 [Mycena indigotica]KAF7312700.1 hypothetical protein MIND_00284700 [Mycena indigotica]